MKNPWKTLSRKLVYKNPWIKVFEDQVIRPDGKKGIYGFVDFYGNGSVAVVPIDNDQKIYLAGQWRYTYPKMSWDIITGFVKRNEIPLSAAKRELKEELGLIARKWVNLGKSHESAGVTKDIKTTFLATGLKKTQANREGTEKIKIKKITILQAIQMIEKGQMSDAASIIGILKTKLFLEEK